MNGKMHTDWPRVSTVTKKSKNMPVKIGLVGWLVASASTSARASKRSLDFHCDKRTRNNTSHSTQSVCIQIIHFCI